MSKPLKFASITFSYGCLLLLLAVTSHEDRAVLTLRTHGFAGGCAVLGYLALVPLAR